MLPHSSHLLKRLRISSSAYLQLDEGHCNAKYYAPSEDRNYVGKDNERKAFEIFEQGDKEGDIYCSFSLANQLISGKGVKKDEKRANEIFARVFPMLDELAKKGETRAQMPVAIAYVHGYGVKQDYKKE
jgi:TPR repeat protein